jgi:hypothetical protein
MIDGSHWGGYLIEPVAGIVPSDASLKEIAAATTERVGIASAKVGKIERALTYYPSPVASTRWCIRFSSSLLPPCESSL